MRSTTLYVAAIACIVATCAGPVKEFYPDKYFIDDCIYQNKVLGFTLLFKDGWTLVTEPSKMERGSRVFARKLHKESGELLFVGTTAEKTQGTRCIGINLNIPTREYAEQIQQLNKNDISEDNGLQDLQLDGRPIVRWDYTVGEYRFVEFFFTVDTYNLRVAFWAKPALFKRFEPVYLSIMSTLSFVPG